MAPFRFGFPDPLKTFLEQLLALRITDAERLPWAADSGNIFTDRVSRRRPMTVASILTLMLHTLLLVLSVPFWGTPGLRVVSDPFLIRPLARAREGSHAAGRPEAAPLHPAAAAPEPKPRLLPIPDPTPNAPEPIVKEPVNVPRIVQELTPELSIGEFTAPPGAQSAADETGDSAKGAHGPDQSGFDPGSGGSTGPHRIGGGVSAPRVLVQTNPIYTDSAIQAKVQGVIVLRAIIRRNGRADSIEVVRGLGFGLEESAIREIASNWRFQPGLLNGAPVDVEATIEVTFNLR